MKVSMSELQRRAFWAKNKGKVYNIDNNISQKKQKGEVRNPKKKKRLFKVLRNGKSRYIGIKKAKQYHNMGYKVVEVTE